MDNSPQLSNPLASKSKVKLALCALGVIICIMILASAPPLSKNSIAGGVPQPAATVPRQLDVASAMPVAYLFEQAAASPQHNDKSVGQGSSSSVQGPYPPQAQASAQPQPVDNQPPAARAAHPPCGYCSGARGTMCPESSGSARYSSCVIED